MSRILSRKRFLASCSGIPPYFRQLEINIVTLKSVSHYNLLENCILARISGHYLKYILKTACMAQLSKALDTQKLYCFRNRVLYDTGSSLVRTITIGLQIIFIGDLI